MLPKSRAHWCRAPVRAAHNVPWFRVAPEITLSMDGGRTKPLKEDAMKILIGVDDSPHSKAAVEFVRKMAWPIPTHVIVLSVVQPASIAYAEAYVPSGYALETVDEMVRFHEGVAASAERVLKTQHLGTEAKVLQGDPRIALVQTAREENADLIVVGSHGRTGLSKLVMGSVASHVVTHAPCSVLVVKKEGP